MPLASPSHRPAWPALPDPQVRASSVVVLLLGDGREQRVERPRDHETVHAFLRRGELVRAGDRKDRDAVVRRADAGDLSRGARAVVLDDAQQSALRVVVTLGDEHAETSGASARGVAPGSQPRLRITEAAGRDLHAPRVEIDVEGECGAETCRWLDEVEVDVAWRCHALLI